MLGMNCGPVGNIVDIQVRAAIKRWRTSGALQVLPVIYFKLLSLKKKKQLKPSNHRGSFMFSFWKYGCITQSRILIIQQLHQTFIGLHIRKMKENGKQGNKNNKDKCLKRCS